MSTKPEVVYVLPDKLGGVYSYVDNLLRYRRPDPFRYGVVLTDNQNDDDTRGLDPFEAADRVERVSFEMPPDNVHHVLRRVARAVGRGPGVIVGNDVLELMTAATSDAGRALVAICHGDNSHYYGIAEAYAPTIDAFVTYTERMASRLRELLPSRERDIHLLRYGVAIPEQPRRPAEGPLRLLYVGRLNRHKGIFDIPLIDRELRARGVSVTWTIQGTGPDEQAFKDAWTDRPDVRWMGYQTSAAVLALGETHDVLVLPCRNEGLPVALLEAGARGLVPVISNLPTGIPEVVEPGVTGYRPEPGDIAGFVESIATLAADRPRVESMSAAVRQLVSTRWEARSCASGYQDLYEALVADRRPWRRTPLHTGSRLDQPWLPNGLVRALRARRRKAR